MKIIKAIMFSSFLGIFIWLIKSTQTDAITRPDIVYYVVSFLFVIILFYMFFVKDKVIIVFVFAFLLGIINILWSYIGWSWGFLLGALILFVQSISLYLYLIHIKEEEKEL